MDILNKLEQIAHRFEEVKQQIIDPEVMSDQKRYKDLNIEYRNLDKIVKKTEEYKEVLGNIENSKEILAEESDPEFREMAKMEIAELEPKKTELEEELKILLIPKDPNDSKNVVLEISAGAGGDEASLFAGDLFRMYERYCDSKGLRFDVTSIHEGSQGGYKEAVATISGEDAYGILKFEAGVHRVQRVPKTESYSAVKLTHKPTGVRVSMQDEKSQHKNLEKAMKILRARIYKIEMDKRKEESDSLRRSMVGSGDRSEKIRTYNFPQSRVTDHRINLTLYNLDAVLNGDLDPVIEPLRMADNAEKLKQGS